MKHVKEVKHIIKASVMVNRDKSNHHHQKAESVNSE